MSGVPPPSALEATAVPVAVLDAAIDWQLRMGSGETSAADREALRRWLDAGADHARAWRQLGELDAALAPAGAPAVRGALLRQPGARRNKLLAGALMLAVAVGMAAAMFDRFQPVSHLLADYQTGTGQRRTIILPDGSVLHLNTRSAVDLAFDANRRALVLRGGEIAVETSHADPSERRPFLVLTPEGSLHALGTRFLVRRLDGATRLTVTEAAVAVRPATCAPAPATPCMEERVLWQGQTTLLGAALAGRPEPAPADADSWKDGMLVVENVPLGAVVAELARHRPGYLGVAPQVAGLRITGTVPLADSDRALLALTAAAPVEIASKTRWWVRVQGIQK